MSAVAAGALIPAYGNRGLRAWSAGSQVSWGSVAPLEHLTALPRHSWTNPGLLPGAGQH